MFDKSFLPDAAFEFVFLTDTHFMEGRVPLDQFPSRVLQKPRTEVALRLTAALEPAVVVHGGDLIMEHPGLPGYPDFMRAALRQIEQSGVAPRLVPGNCDVGDKPDPTMPTRDVTSAHLEWYHHHVGPTWYSFEEHGCHFVVLNAQLMNTGIPEEQEQQDWLERDLAENDGRRIFLFLHMPLYLVEPDEPGFGHYEIIDQPARAWLLELIQRYRIEMVFAGHVHFAFFDHIGSTRMVVGCSPSFCRTSFAQVFVGAPAPEHGRNDTAKLGIYLCRVRDARTDVHFIRTAGATELPADGPLRLVTRTAGSLLNSPLGITLSHPLANVAEAPVAWPSVIRQPVRNDYPLLASIELGATHVRVPWRDLRAPLQSRRLAILRDEGIRITGVAVWPDGVPEAMVQHSAQVDGWEVQLPGSLQPPPGCLEALGQIGVAHPKKITLTPVIPRVERAGSLYPRTRVGYRPDEAVALDDHLEEQAACVDRILCAIAAGEFPWETVSRLRQRPLRRIGAIDCLLELQGEDQDEHARRAAEAFLAVLHLPGARLFLDPLVDMDRTNDVQFGLLDTLCNPRPAFHVLRCLNTILHDLPAAGPGLRPSMGEGSGVRVCELTGPGRAVSLLLSSASSDAGADASVLAELPGAATVQLYRLHSGTSERTTLDVVRNLVDRRGITESVLVVG